MLTDAPRPSAESAHFSGRAPGSNARPPEHYPHRPSANTIRATDRIIALKGGNNGGKRLGTFGNLSLEPASNDQERPDGEPITKGDAAMLRMILPVAAAMVLGGATVALAQGPDKSVAKSPPAEPYQQVSKLVKLPDFIPGLGQLFVDPSTLPAGPFLAYDHDGKLVSTIYMIPVKDLNPNKKFDDLAAPGGAVDHVDVYYNAGHPGVETPHAHIVLWHVASGEESRVAK